MGRKKKVRSITIIGRRWFDKINGNTYFSANIYVNNEHVKYIPESYGYGDYYQQAAFEWLHKNGYIKEDLYVKCDRTDPTLDAEVQDPIERNATWHGGSTSAP